MLQNLTSGSSATLRRTLLLWLGSNVGGTLWLLADFSLGRLNDYSIALMAGLLAALVSLAIVPLAIPFFTLMTAVGAGWSRRSMALVGTAAFYLSANQLLLLLLPVDCLSSLLAMSAPYLGAALLMVLWLYGPAATRQ